MKLLGPKGVLDTEQDLSLYEYDGGVDKARPGYRGFSAQCARMWRRS